MMIKYHHLKEKSWFHILIKIMSCSKQLLQNSSNYISASSSRWNEILNILISIYRHKLFYNYNQFGGRNGCYGRLIR